MEGVVVVVVLVGMAHFKRHWQIKLETEPYWALVEEDQAR